MRLLKIVSVVFAIYLFRRFMQMYRVMEEIQRERAQNPEAPKPHPEQPQRKEKNIIEADFKVVDR